MKKKKWILVITSILMMLLACTQIHAATVKAPANIKVTASKKASISIKWSKVSNASGYEIWRANSAKGNYSKIKTIKTKILPAMQTKNFLQDITITKYVLIKP